MFSKSLQTDLTEIGLVFQPSISLPVIDWTF